MVKVISDSYVKGSMMSDTKERSRSPKRHAPTRHSKTGQWIEILRSSDVSRLWSELHRIVCQHPLVRSSRSAGLLVEEGARNAYTDLTQELFVVLLSKGRFQHYLDTEMTDSQIECEIGQIELTNILTAELRKRHPESYRLAIRISTLIQSSTAFRRFDATGAETEPHRRLANQVYGLSEWPDGKPRRDHHDLELRAQSIPVRLRDTRTVGCTGDSQVVISNPDLENLIVSVLKAVDAPVDVRGLRSLVMSRLPVMDIYLVPLSGDDDEHGKSFEPVDSGANPEQRFLKNESEGAAAGYVDRFLESLRKSARGKIKQYNRMLGVLWHCYLSPDHRTQLEVAEALSVSDSLVSDYRRRIEQELRALSFSEIEEARRFETALREHVGGLMVVADEAQMTI